MSEQISQRSTAATHEEYAARVAAIDEATIAWFSGWLCADGCIAEHSDGRPTIKFTICDIDPLEKFAALFGNAVGGPWPPSGLGVKPRYSWIISGWKAAVILERVKPWLSERYTERAERVSQWEPRGHAGRKLTPADVAIIKAELKTGKHGIGRRLAERFGVSDAMISHIRKERMWAA